MESPTETIRRWLIARPREAIFRAVFREVHVRAVAPHAPIRFVVNNCNNGRGRSFPTQQPMSMNNYTSL